MIDFITCKGALSEPLAKHVFRITAQTLSFIHQSGLVHRDIKSDNIMITSKCVPCVLDFGFAVHKAGELDNGFFEINLGTPGYMAPEIHQRLPYNGEHADIFALGVILFQMVMGRAPFEEAV